MLAPRLLAAALLAAVLPMPGAEAAHQPPAGEGCRYLAVGDDNLGADTWHGVLHGGPVTGDGTVQLTCRIVVNAWTHDATAAVTVSSLPTPRVAALEPTRVSFEAGYDDFVAMCTSVRVNGITWYETHGGWSTDPASYCWKHLPWELVPEPLRPVVDGVACLVFGDACDVIGPLLGEVFEVVDPAVCERFVAAAPGVPPVEIRPDGDVYVNGEWWWDCPPYGNGA